MELRRGFRQRLTNLLAETFDDRFAVYDNLHIVRIHVDSYGSTIDGKPPNYYTDSQAVDLLKRHIGWMKELCQRADLCIQDAESGIYDA